MQSVISYKDRGKWGNNKYRGNCSGYVIVDLIKHFKPKTFMDITEGGSTSREVCRELGVKYIGLDLHKGFDFTSVPLLSRSINHADMVFSHPPYHDMIVYSDNINDLSNCNTTDEFLTKIQVMLFNQRDATKSNGHYVSLIGDYRKNGLFYSFQSDMINMMPKSELISVTVKMQWNCVSDSRSYTGNFIPIKHEYLLIWRKSDKSFFNAVSDIINSYENNFSMTWQSVVRIALMNSENDEVTLNYLYSEVTKIAPKKVEQNAHFKAKVRQTLQKYFTNVKRGVWQN